MCSGHYTRELSLTNTEGSIQRTKPAAASLQTTNATWLFASWRGWNITGSLSAGAHECEFRKDIRLWRFSLRRLRATHRLGPLGIFIFAAFAQMLADGHGRAWLLAAVSRHQPLPTLLPDTSCHSWYRASMQNVTGRFIQADKAETYLYFIMRADADHSPKQRSRLLMTKSAHATHARFSRIYSSAILSILTFHNIGWLRQKQNNKAQAVALSRMHISGFSWSSLSFQQRDSINTRIIFSMLSHLACSTSLG